MDILSCLFLRYVTCIIPILPTTVHFDWGLGLVCLLISLAAHRMVSAPGCYGQDLGKRHTVLDRLHEWPGVILYDRCRLPK
jgi:hypothetical protein